ncbi:Hypothetical protein R9X50_00354000 [Acrodontium crateriforme]|uniref:RFX-type winged-helix domain-containing protein n=1 Tax=Acrodontium crateriforme TaxID=150365 RepID=A0AAQ3M4H3_9PEZI|nr:Hypothetical protein R9X50_00354000 [Acrodontium crateriforme]
MFATLGIPLALLLTIVAATHQARIRDETPSMAARHHRPHLSMSAQSRPASRASTTSATSQQHDVNHLFSAHDAKQAQHVEGPEAALLQYQASIVPQPQYDMVGHPQQTMAHHHPQAVQYPMQGNFFDHEQLQQPDMSYAHPIRVGSVPLRLGSEVPDDKRRKGSAVTATNDKELREMLSKNEGRPLRDVAQEVIQKERTPMAEKTKQLFAMLWLRAVCKPAKTSVPRNRVYSQYANRCGTERVVPLNPASFGKLVRVIFPGIQTRRLGVRGESKYHYVDLALDDESTNSITNPGWNGGASFQSNDNAPRRSESASIQQIDFNNIPRLQADTAAFPPAESLFDMNQHQQQQQQQQPSIDRGPASQGRAFVYPDTRGMQPGGIESMTYPQILRFPSSSIPSFSENEPVNLPAIQPYLPPRTDSDTAEALYALYRTHCTSLIDSIRFCKEKQFFRLYTSFHGTLTVPVQKLFTHPNLAPWIEQCDLVMYRTMVRFVSRLTLQAAPVVVINILSNISGTLHAHIAKTFAQQPPHVLEAKLRPATVFAGLLHRLIRVNQSAHAAANLLTIDQNREQMWREWVTMVNPKRVMEAELPNCGYEETYKILTSEMRNLLEPLQAPSFQDDPYGMHALSSFEADNAGFASFMQSQSSLPGSRNGQSQVSTENVLDRWSGFIASLPARFPQASARTLLHCISTVGTAALRDITIMNGLSYGHWWVLKIFVDEMSLWMAEMGGFLEGHSMSVQQNASNRMFQSPTMQSTNSRSQTGSRMGSMAPDSAGGGSASNGQNSAAQQFFFDPNAQQHQSFVHPHGMELHQNMSFQHQHSQMKPQQHDADIDDSGIGMSLMDDDLTFAKLGVTNPHVGMEGMGAPDMRVEPL